MKRWIVAVGAVLATIAAAAVVAPPAQAGIDNPYVWAFKPAGDVCQLEATNVSTPQREITVTGNPGDSFRLLNSQCGAANVLLSGGVVTGPRSLANGASATYTLAATPGSGTLLLLAPLGTVAINIVVTAVPVATPVIDTHDTIQQVGVPTSGDCADVRPSVGHYPGFPVGGWSKSWAYWINDGKGGPVCTREIYYDAGLGEWRYVGQQ